MDEKILTQAVSQPNGSIIILRSILYKFLPLQYLEILQFLDSESKDHLEIIFLISIK
jgi:hypothetical protein